ncbi:hypothetical protein [Shewanella japonica]|uniref:hypothetical protein n=1 Tax=Shewanella japonica TaxID=93973 RepID=UPI0024954E66|nr:hypothetical protein [Shewanella japonica]
MNNPLVGTDPTGYAGCAASRIQSKCDTTLSQHGGNGKADGKFFGGSSKSSGTVKSNGGGNYTASFQLNKTTSLEVDFKVNDIGGQEQIASNSGGYSDDELNQMGFAAGTRFINDLGGDFRLLPGGVNIAQDQAIRSNASGQAGFAGAVLLTGGALSAYIGAEAVGVVFIAGSGGDIESVAMARLPGLKLSARTAATFKDGSYTNRQLAKATNFFKYHGVDNRTGKKISWLTNKKYASEADLRAGLAIRHDWGVNINRVSTFRAPKGTWISEGTAAAQGAGYPGGGYQAVISNLPKQWITRTDKAF